MKFIKLICIFAVSLIFAGPAHVIAGPRAVAVAPVFEFEHVFEGEHLTHDFIIQNQGDTPLNILGVRPP